MGFVIDKMASGKVCSLPILIPPTVPHSPSLGTSIIGQRETNVQVHLVSAHPKKLQLHKEVNFHAQQHLIFGDCWIKFNLQVLSLRLHGEDPHIIT